MMSLCLLRFYNDCCPFYILVHDFKLYFQKILNLAFHNFYEFNHIFIEPYWHRSIENYFTSQYILSKERLIFISFTFFVVWNIILQVFTQGLFVHLGPTLFSTLKVIHRKLMDSSNGRSWPLGWHVLPL